MDKKTPQEKINEALGIETDISEILDTLTTSNNKISDQLATIDTAVKTNVDKIDNEIAKYENNTPISLDNIQSSLREINQLIDVSKGIIKRVYDEVVTSSLLDPEVIAAAAKMIEATRISVADYLDLYKHRLDFYDQVRLEMLKHNNKKELMNMKHDLDLSKNSAVGNVTDMIPFDSEQIIKIMSDVENK